MKRAKLNDDDEADHFGGGQAGCHPLKNLRRQAVDGLEEDDMPQGRPAAKVVNMRAR